jgi:diketogulonate reductase-like aldo/keto reductase
VLWAKTNPDLYSFVPLPKSATPSRIKSNAQLYDFELDEEDMIALNALDIGKAGAVSWNPVDFA